jgi:stage III sporulation protein AA
MDIKNEDFLNAAMNINYEIRKSLMKISDKIKENVHEICIRAGHAPMVLTPEESYFVMKDGSLAKSGSEDFSVKSEDLNDTFKILCNFSVYSFQNQIKNGFITVKGGHRAGICGSAVIIKGEIINIVEISSISLRISRQITGCSDEIFAKFGPDLGGTLLAGPPMSGKTTILRDIARKISSLMINGRLKKTVIIDERREIAAVYDGIPQKDIGLADVLSDFPKGVGIAQATRTLAPQIIICDEIGSKADASSIRESLNSGVEIIASVHAETAEEIINSVRIRTILNSGAIKRVVFLGNREKLGKIKSVYKIEN